jgi:SAM-dependent MidA family methyltransferase
MERLDAFMARANAAYYATHDPFRDFTTSPEITQVFGELLGAWAAVVWQGMGRPEPVILAEAGPGRGTLMQDAVRTIAKVAPGFHAAASIHLIETSPRLRAQQAARLPTAVWHDHIEALPPGPMILLANEFFDALPIRQFSKAEAGWDEHHVKDGQLVKQPANPPLPPAGEGWGEGVEGTYEINEPARAITRHIAARVAAQNGAALILDYGPARSGPGNTLQAIHHGRPANPLEDPGSRDLTAHVDFAPLAGIARDAGAAVHGPIQQGPFLARLGLFQRTGALARNQPPARASALIQAAQRLAEPDRMGGLFKAMAITHPALPSPPGFAP